MKIHCLNYLAWMSGLSTHQAVLTVVGVCGAERLSGRPDEFGQTVAGFIVSV